jgi:starch synthase (maltosyl-transferring)
MAQRASIAHPRILAFPSEESLRSGLESSRQLGFRQCLLRATDGAPGLTLSAQGGIELAQLARAADVDLWLDLAIDLMPVDHPLVAELPSCFAIRRSLADTVVDPRRPEVLRGYAKARFDLAGSLALVNWWCDAVAGWVAQGVAGFCIRRPAAVAASVWRRLTEAARVTGANIAFLADTTGVDRAAVARLVGCGIDFTLSSLPWWDGRAGWLVEEHAALSQVAPPVALIGGPAGSWPLSVADRVARLRLATVTGAGMLMPAGFEAIHEQVPEAALVEAVRAANAAFESDAVAASSGTLRALTGPGAAATALLRGVAGDGPLPAAGLLALVNPDPVLAAPVPTEIFVRTGGDLVPAEGGEALKPPLAPGEIRLVPLHRAKPVKSPRRDEALAAADPRVVIDDIAPAVNHGAFAVKRLFGETLVVEADIFADGHEKLAAEIFYRPEDSKNWSRAAIEPVVNDRWRGSFVLERIGRYVFMVEAWVDVWGGFVRDFGRKRDAGQRLEQEIAEARALIEAAAGGAPPRPARILNKALAAIDKEAGKGEGAADAILAADLAGAMAAVDPRRFRTVSFVQPVQVDRQAGAFAAWYELFPRSETDDKARHGRLLDVVDRLPAIRAMGFDVLYFPPIHPIGRKNRKGRNNSLTAAPDDPGSPYAIGAAEGGHDAIHPELGTLDDFGTLVAAAQEHGLELALDFAVQCSPDHPWLKEHPGWFAWRPDGSMKYAENPPKKYEDIVNVDFYATAAIPSLWLALRDVVAFWIAQGVRIFRVDNPHTKPLPFWEWLIGDIRALHPDVLFLAEAFTRPKLMYRLAKLGFTQSYTYFTWRNTKAELTEYLTELTTTEAREFFRPHFFVNTPDINPYFLQTSGRTGFLIRAALAATLSGLWGIYSGFELCEFEPLPGREEYKDSEKYEIRPRNWTQPGNIVAEIATLNRIRRSEPALQSHLGITFYNAFNDRIIYFAKSVAGQADKILVAISLDPHAHQEADIEVPLWDWGMPDSGSLDVTDLVHGNRFAWNGKMQHIRLTREWPFSIWRVQPLGGGPTDRG